MLRRRLAAAFGVPASKVPRSASQPRPDCVRFCVRDGFTASEATPVSIFVGSEPAQFRAERVLLWSIEAVRDPTRVYEVHLMRDLSGFDRTRWRTGFTNYRFAVPSLAGGRGRAIYNDVDQIYLRDPAELFDLEMRDHAVLALATGAEIDSAVMLLDCERMLEVWTLAAARSQTKKRLLRAAENRVGALVESWHVRDAEWDGASAAHLLHFTTLHSQPWQPQPERYSYFKNPHAALWRDLETQADAAGYQTFTRKAPSRDFKARLAVAKLRGLKSETTPELESALVEAKSEGCADTHRYCDPLLTHSPPQAADVVTDCAILNQCLENVSRDDVPWLLDEAFAAARHVVLAEVVCSSDRSASEWSNLFVAASRQRPHVHWHLLCRIGGRVTHRRGGRYLGRGEPRVWVCGDEAIGEVAKRDSTRSLRGLADAVGAKWESRSLQGPSFDLPWPDLLLVSGERATRAARRIKQASQARTRVVHVGEISRTRRAGIDLVVTPMPEVRLDPRPALEPLRRGVARLAQRQGLSRRGTQRPQRGIERLCARLLVRGVVNLPRGWTCTPLAPPESDTVQLLAQPQREADFPLGGLESAARRVRGLLQWDRPC